MIKAYSYIRFSTAEQAHGDSLRRQQEAAREYAAKHGLDLDESYIDEGISAYDMSNVSQGALGRFLNDVQQGRIEKGSLLIVENLDRLSRGPLGDAQYLFTGLLRAGIEVVTLTDGRHYDRSSLNDLGDLLISMTAMQVAHIASARKSGSVAKAWQEKRRLAAEGKPMTALCPFWLKLKDDRSGFELVPEYAVIAQAMFIDTIRGVGRRTMVKKLNTGDVPPPAKGRRQAQRWHVSLISKTIANRAAIGEFVSTRGDVDPIAGYYPAIVDEATYYQAQAAAVSRRKSGGPKGKSFGNLLTGMCRCIECGGTVRFQYRPEGKGGRYLYCDNHKNERCSNKKRWKYEDVEGMALIILADVVDWIQAYGGHDDRKRAIEGALAVEHAALSRAEHARDRFKGFFIAAADDVKDDAAAAWEQAIRDVSTVKNAIKNLESELAGYMPAQANVATLKQALGKLEADCSYEDRAHVNSVLKNAGLELWFSDAGVVWRVGDQKGVVLDGPTADYVGELVGVARVEAAIDHIVSEHEALKNKYSY